MNYSDQLQTKEWKLKRFHILLRDKFKCYFCGYLNKNNHVHHKRYIEGLKAWEYDDSELITVCRDCHRKIHFSLIQYKIIESTKIGNIIKKHILN